MESISLQNTGKTGCPVSESFFPKPSSVVIAAQERPSYRNILAPAPLVTAPTESCEMTAQRKGEYLSIKIDDALVKYGVSMGYQWGIKTGTIFNW